MRTEGMKTILKKTTTLLCGCGLNKMSHLADLKVNFSSVLELFGDGKVKLPLIYETVSTIQNCNIYVR